MADDTRTTVYNYIKTHEGAVTLETIKKELGITERNAVEQAVLTDLNTGRLELTAKGVKIRA